MWGRLYPYVVSLILANVLLEASCKGSSSLTFVVESSRYMTPFKKTFQDRMDRILDVVFDDPTSVIDNLLLITLGTKVAKLQVMTKNRTEFHEKVNDDIYRSNAGWTSTSFLDGLNLALNKSNYNSYIYVFASVLHASFNNSLAEMCQKKQSQIIFSFLTDDYDYSYDYDDLTKDFHIDAAQSCSSLMFELDVEGFNQVFKAMEETIKGNKTVIKKETISPNENKNIPFTVDNHIDYAIVSVAGYDVSLVVKGPSNNLETIMWLKNAKVVKLHNTKAGQYIASVKGEKTASVIIVGGSHFSFSYGFSELKPKLPNDTVPQPVAYANVYLSIFITDEHHLVNISSTEILQMDGESIKNMSVIETTKDIYLSEPFHAPSHMFQVAVNGIIKATGRAITKISAKPVTPREQRKQIPTIEIVEGKTLEVEYNSTVKLTCKVTAYPEPKITWYNSKGVEMSSESTFTNGSFLSNMNFSKATNSDKYKCYAMNSLGKNDTTINVIVKNPFNVGSVPAAFTKLMYGKEGIITCNITSHLPMDINWYYESPRTGIKKQIETSDKYMISTNKTQLKIIKIDLDLQGRYVCQAFLKTQEDVKREFFTQLKAIGLVAPKLQGPAEIPVDEGKTAEIECKVVSGLPPPKITWQFGGLSGSKFKPISGSETVLRITNVTDKDVGHYKCVAKNKEGKDELVIKLLIPGLPKIISSKYIIHQVVEGHIPLKVPCDAIGFPKPVIIWSLGRNEITPNKKYSIENGTLIIKDPKTSDTNSYTCEAKNKFGSVIVTFKTHVHRAATDASFGTSESKKCMENKGEQKSRITLYMDNSDSKRNPTAGPKKNIVNEELQVCRP